MSKPMFPVPKDAESAGATEVSWYAGLAMQAIIAQQGIPESDSAREEIAIWAIRMGQAMVATGRSLHSDAS